MRRPAGGNRDSLSSAAAGGFSTQQTLAGAGLVVTLVLALGGTLLVGRPGALALASYLMTLLLLVPFVRRQQLVFVVACVVSGVVLFAEGKSSDLTRALTQSVGLAVLLVALIWLRLAASHSASIATVSRYVAAGPRAYRHLGLALGSHLIGVLLSVGVFGLMAPLVARAKAAAAEERDMALSVVRGFGFTILWSPTAAAQVVIISVVPGVTWGALAPSTIPMAISLIMLSWAFSAYLHRGIPASPVPRAELDLGAFAALGGLIAVMLGLIAFLHTLSGYGLTASVAVASLSVATIWMTLQALRHGDAPLRALRRNLTAYVRIDLARGAPEIVTLGAAGFLGIAIAALIPSAWLRTVVSPLSEHVLFLYLAVTVLVPLISAFGLNPLVAASIIGGSFAAIPTDHGESTMLAFALASGWAVAYGISPFTTGALVFSQMLGIRPETITWRWNGPFTLVALAYACVVVAAMSIT